MLEFKFLSGARSSIIDSLKFDVQGFVVGRNSCWAAMGPAGCRASSADSLMQRVMSVNDASQRLHLKLRKLEVYAAWQQPDPCLPS